MEGSVEASRIGGSLTNKPTLAPKPRLTPKPFSLQQNASIRSIHAPKSPTSTPTGELQPAGVIRPTASSPAPNRSLPKSSSGPEPSPVRVAARAQPKLSEQNHKADIVNDAQNREESGSDGSSAAASTYHLGSIRKRLPAALTSMFESGGPPPVPKPITNNTKDTSSKPVSPSPEKSNETPEPSNKERDEPELKEDYTGGNSIKRRISLLFDSSSRPEAAAKTEEQVIVNGRGDVKDRIKHWAAESSSDAEKEPQVVPRARTRSFERMTSPVAEEPPQTATVEPPAAATSPGQPVHRLPKLPPAEQPTAHQTEALEELNNSTQSLKRRPSLRSADNGDLAVGESAEHAPQRNNFQRRSVRFGTVERDDGGPPLMLGSASESSEEEEENEKTHEDETKQEVPVSVPVYRRVSLLQRKDDEIKNEEERPKHGEFEKRRRAEEQEQARLKLEEEIRLEKEREKERAQEREALRLREEEKQSGMLKEQEEHERRGKELARERLQEEEREREQFRKEEMEKERQKELMYQRQREEERERERQMEENLKQDQMERERLKDEERRQDRLRVDRERQRREEEERERAGQVEEKLRQEEREMEILREEADERERARRRRLEEEERMQDRLRREEDEERRRREYERKMQQEKEDEMERIRQIEKQREEEIRRQIERERMEELERRKREEEMERLRQIEKQKEEDVRRQNESERIKELERRIREEEMEKMRLIAKHREEEMKWKIEKERMEELERRVREEETERLRLIEKQREEERRRQIEKERDEEMEQMRLREKQREDEIKKQIERERMEESERRIREEEMERLRQKDQQREVERRRQIEEERAEEMERLRQIEQQREVERRRQIEEERAEEMERLRQIEQQREVERRRQIEEEREEEMERLRQIEQQREEAEKRLREEMLQGEEERTRKESWLTDSQIENTVDRTEPSLSSFDSEDVNQRSKSPYLSQSTRSPTDNNFDDFSVKKPENEVVYDDFSVKPRIRGSRNKVETPPATHIRAADLLDREETLVPLDTRPQESKEPEWTEKSDSTMLTPTSMDVVVEERKRKDKPERKRVCFTDVVEVIERHEELEEHEDEVEEESWQEAQVDSYHTNVEEKDTDAFIDSELDKQEVISEQPRQSESPQPVLDEAPDFSSEDPDSSDFQREPELVPFPESATPLLDTSAQRSRVELGKRRSRSRPTRSFRAGLDETERRDWRTRDTTVENKTAQRRSDSEDEQPISKVVSSPPSKRVPVFAGVSPASLIAQLKKRSTGGGSGGREEEEADKAVEEKESQNDEVVIPPSPLPRSPRSPAYLAGAARVLPPIGGKDGGTIASPAWLKELKSKKRLSQYDGDA